MKRKRGIDKLSPSPDSSSSGSEGSEEAKEEDEDDDARSRSKSGSSSPRHSGGMYSSLCRASLLTLPLLPFPLFSPPSSTPLFSPLLPFPSLPPSLSHFYVHTDAETAEKLSLPHVVRSRFDSDDEDELSGDEVKEKPPPTLSRLFTGYQETSSDEEKHQTADEQEKKEEGKKEEEAVDVRGKDHAAIAIFTSPS